MFVKSTRFKQVCQLLLSLIVGGIIYQWASPRLFIPRGDNVFPLCIKSASRAFLTASQLYWSRSTTRRSGTTLSFIAVDFLILYILIFVLFSFVRVADVLIVFFFVFFSRTVLLTSWNRTQRSKSHSRVTWGFMVIISVIGGISSSMETNAVDQWRLRLLFTTTGHLGTLICSIIGHLRGTVKISHKERLEWNYG